MTTPPSNVALRIGLLGLPLSAGLLGSKVHKAILLEATALDVLRVTTADFVLLLTLGVLALSMGFVPWRAPRLGLLLLAHALAPLLTTLAVVEHAFFLTTGTIGDGYLLAEALRRVREIADIVASEVTPWRAVSLALPWLWSALVAFLVPRLERSPRVARGARRGLVAVGSALAVGALIGFAVPTENLAPELLSARRSVPWGIVYDLVDELAGDTVVARGGAPLPPPPTLTRIDRAPRAKNLITIVLESASAKGSGLYPDASYPTRGKVMPYLAGLAQRGALVDQAYSVVPHTSKALVSVHCGIYPKLHIRIDEATGGIPTHCLARLLADQGYGTAFFQAAEQGYENRIDLVREIGFEHFVGKELLDPQGFDESNYFGYEDDVLVEPLLAWIAEQKDPFYASVLTVTSHHPYSVPKGFRTKSYAKNRRLNDYLNTLAYTDRFLSKVVKGLEKQGRLEDTAVIIVGDHGEAFGEHGRYQHDSAVYEETLRVPMVLLGAGVPEGTRVGGLRQHVDIVPTAVGLLGFRLSGEVLGRDLFSTPGHEKLFMSCYYKDFCRGLRTRTHKFIDNYKRRGMEVYDLTRDPLEKENLVKEDGPWSVKAHAALGELERLTDLTNARYEAHARERFLASVTDTRPAIAHPVDLDFGAVRLIGYDLEPAVMEAGETTYMTLYYHVEEAPPDGLFPFVHVYGHKFIDVDHVPAGGAYPVEDWEAGKYVRDRFPIRTRPRFPARDYRVLTGFRIAGKGRVTPEVKGNLVVEDRAVHVASYTLTEPKEEPRPFLSRTEPAVPHPIAIRFGDDVALLGATLDRTAIKSGIKVHANLVWHALRRPAEGLTARFRLVGPREETFPHVPVSGDHPFSAWSAGDYVTDDAVLLTSERTPSGDYKVFLEVFEGEHPRKPTGTGLPVEGDGVLLGTLEITRL